MKESQIDHYLICLQFFPWKTYDKFKRKSIFKSLKSCSWHIIFVGFSWRLNSLRERSQGWILLLIMSGLMEGYSSTSISNSSMSTSSSSSNSVSNSSQSIPDYSSWRAANILDNNFFCSNNFFWIVFKFIRKFGSYEGNELAGFFVFSQ